MGGVERATLQSSYITEWLFTIHEDVKKRALECFLETAKIALKGRSKKFQHILSDMSVKMIEIDGDEFADADYGLVVDNSTGTQKLNEKLDVLAQAALQNQTLSFSVIMKLYSSSSVAEKQRLVEKNEQEMQQMQQQSNKAQLEAEQAKIEKEAQIKEEEIQQRERANIRDNETKILLGQMAQFANEETSEDVDYSPEAKEQLMEKIRQFDEKLKLEKERFSFEREKHKDDVRLKEKQINKPVSSAKK